MDAGTLYNAISVVCPIISVSVGKPLEPPTWSFIPDPSATPAQIAAAQNVIDTIDPVVKNIIPFHIFISRWTTTELSNLYKARATAIQTNGAGMTLVKNWDVAQAQNSVDLNSPAALNFKASIVAAGLLTQVRADAIFS
jgi:hypothetical protein